MGQFKPMVKMQTTEPSVILKLKKGGHVKTPKMKAETNGTGHKKMAGGGALAMMEGTPALVGRPAINAPVRVPGRPGMAARKRAMLPKQAALTSSMPPSAPPSAAMPSAPPMKKGGKAEGKHDDAAEDRAMIKKAMAGKKFATGGVAMKNAGGYKDGGGVPKSGIIKTTTGKTTKMNTTHPNHSPAKTGDVKEGNAGGYAKGGGVSGNVSTTPAGVTNTTTGGVKKGNAGGYAKGGAPKKYADGGRVQDDGRAVKMPQGKKRPPSPVSINQLSGTYKKGGKVKMAQGGDAQQTKNADAYKNWEKDERKFNEGLRSDVEDAITYPFRKGKELFDKLRGQGSVTESEKSVTVSPGKKRGGRC